MLVLFIVCKFVLLVVGNIFFVLLFIMLVFIVGVVLKVYRDM